MLKEISKDLYLNDKTKIVPIIDDPKTSKSHYCVVCFTLGEDRFLDLPHRVELFFLPLFMNNKEVLLHCIENQLPVFVS